jgi:hypothetical protein
MTTGMPVSAIAAHMGSHCRWFQGGVPWMGNMCAEKPRSALRWTSWMAASTSQVGTGPVRPILGFPPRRSSSQSL